MGQGTVYVQPPSQRSPIEGIFQALQAVHSYYGIDTEKQQQALLKAQTEKEQIGVENARYQQSVLKDLTDQFSNKTPPPSPQSQNSETTGMPANRGVTEAGNDNGITPLSSFQKQAQSPQSNNERTNQLLEKYAQNPIAAGMVEPIIKANTSLSEMKLKKGASLTEAGNKFDTATKDYSDKYNSAQAAMDQLGKMNPQSDNAAVAELTKAVGARVTAESMEAIGGNKALWDTLLNKLSQKEHGLLSPEERLAVATAADTMKASAYSAMKNIGTQHASRYLQINGGEGTPEEFSNKNFLSGYGNQSGTPQLMKKLEKNTKETAPAANPVLTMKDLATKELQRRAALKKNK